MAMKKKQSLPFEGELDICGNHRHNSCKENWHLCHRYCQQPELSCSVFLLYHVSRSIALFKMNLTHCTPGLFARNCVTNVSTSKDNVLLSWNYGKGGVRKWSGWQVERWRGCLGTLLCGYKV